MKNIAKSKGYLHQRGEIKESAIKALVTDKLFRTRVERHRKGKGSYQRKAKHSKAFENSETPFKNRHDFKMGFLFVRDLLRW